MRKSLSFLKYEFLEIILRALDFKKFHWRLGKLRTRLPRCNTRRIGGANSWYHRENYVYKERESLITPSRNVTPISNNIRDMFSECGSINPSRFSGESGGKLAPWKITFIFAYYARIEDTMSSLGVIVECARDFVSLRKIERNSLESLARARHPK